MFETDASWVIITNTQRHVYNILLGRAYQAMSLRLRGPHTIDKASNLADYQRYIRYTTGNLLSRQWQL